MSLVRNKVGLLEFIQRLSLQNYYFYFLLLILAQIFFWTLIPSLLLKNTYVDILENLAWGQHFQWGYDKDPFLAAFISYWIYQLSGYHLSAIYFFSQLSIAICFFAVFELAKRILTLERAFIAVSLLITIHYYSHSSPEFNDDVLQLPFWALTMLFFYDAIQFKKNISWLLVGLCAACSLMTKYYGIMLLLSMFSFLFIDQKARYSLLTVGPYLAFITFLLVISPNLFWLYQHSFIAIHYALDRATISQGMSNHILTHLTNPLSFLWSMFGVVAPTILVSVFCFRKKSKQEYARFDWSFIFCMGLGPLFFTLVFSGITGANIHYMWGTPLFNLFGMMMVMLMHPTMNLQSMRNYLITMAAIFSLWLGIYIWGILITPYTTQEGSHETLPGKTMALGITRAWHERYHTPLAYVAGDRELALNIATYSPDHPQPLFDWNMSLSPWINAVELNKKGVVYVYQLDPREPRLPREVLNHFKNAQNIEVQSYDWAVWEQVRAWLHFKKIPPVKILVGDVQASRQGR